MEKLYNEVRNLLYHPEETFAYYHRKVKDVAEALAQNGLSINVFVYPPTSKLGDDMRIYAKRDALYKGIHTNFPRWTLEGTTHENSYPVVIKGITVGDPKDLCLIKQVTEPLPNLPYAIHTLKNISRYLHGEEIEDWKAVKEFHISGLSDLLKAYKFIRWDARDVPLTHLKINFINYTPSNDFLDHKIFSITNEDKKVVSLEMDFIDDSYSDTKYKLLLLEKYLSEEIMSHVFNDVNEEKKVFL